MKITIDVEKRPVRQGRKHDFKNIIGCLLTGSKRLWRNDAEDMV
jgi:hypothetical protein